MDESSFILLYKSMVRPHLEYANSVWCPHNSTQLNSTENYGRRRLTPLSPHRKLGDIKEIEKVQKRATKLVINLKKIPYTNSSSAP